MSMVNSDVNEEANDPLITETGLSFRDRISTIDKKGKRIWIYPYKPKGRFHVWRLIVGYILIALLFIMPFIRIGDNPFFLLNFIERKFSFFGIMFWPQDIFILALSFLALLVFVVLFTAVFGRIWCGWACPQTIFMELVFRKIEYLIEGDSPKQRTLNKAEWNAKKFFKKSIKHVIFFIISFIISNLLLAYIIGGDQLIYLVSSPPGEHVNGLTAMIIFSLVFYGIFARFRENACIYVCPYGRLQSVLLDKNSVIVAYDRIRGEPRGKLTKNQENTSGDCIDCGNCIRVCPTGIDIRNGTQLECINCTACIDSCDEIMDKIKKPRKLIKYASINLIEKGEKFRITPRISLYTLILAVLVTIISILLLNMTTIETSILRARGQLYQKLPDGRISNLFTAQFINKSGKRTKIHLKLENFEGSIRYTGQDKIDLLPDNVTDISFFVDIPANKIKSFSSVIEIGIYDETNRRIDKVKTKFLGPKTN